jgi:hypothetical protein
MPMPKQRSDSELLREGCRSYNKALAAVWEFRREVHQAIRTAIDERIDDLAAAMRLGKAEISEGLTAYADPANAGQGWNGSQAEVGLKYPAKPWEARWAIYFYFWIGDGEGGHASALFWLKEPGLAMKRLASLAVEGLETDDKSAWIPVRISDPDGFTSAIGRVLDAWIEIWRKAGGIQQFLPPQKARENPAGI